MAEKINGWTISSRDNYGTRIWQAVNSEGTIGIANENKATVVTFAARTNPQNYGKK